MPAMHLQTADLRPGSLDQVNDRLGVGRRLPAVSDDDCDGTDARTSAPLRRVDRPRQLAHRLLNTHTHTRPDGPLLHTHTRSYNGHVLASCSGSAI